MRAIRRVNTRNDDHTDREETVMRAELSGHTARAERGGRVAAVTALAALTTTLLLAAPAPAQDAQARGIDAACPRAAREGSPALAHPPGFPDVTGNVHEAAITCLAHWGVAQGTQGRYLPDEAVRRDQMASFLARTVRPTDHSLPESPGATFGDTAGNVHADNIDALSEADVVRGREDGDYHPDEPVSRAAMASFVARTLEAVTGEELSGDGEPAFPDTAGSVHRDNIDALASLGVVQGRPDGTYEPRAVVRRDQMASFLARSMDRLAEQGHWPVPATVELEPAEDTNPSNFVHRLRGTVYNQWGQEDPEHTYHGADVRVEVYRQADGRPTLVHADRVVSGMGGDLSYAYNADASTGDADVVAACPVTAGDDPGADAEWCASVTTADGQSTVEAHEDRGAVTVTASWTEPAPAEPAGDGHYTGSVVSHDVAQGTLELQTARRPGGDGERLVRLAYDAADGFVVNTASQDHPDASASEFSCAVEAGLDHDDEAYPHLSVEYRVDGESLYELSTPADVGHCFPDQTAATLPCEGSENGVVYATRYPADWWASDGTQAESCRWFHPERFDMPDQPQEVTEVAVMLRITDVAFDEAKDLDPERNRLVSEHRTTVDGRPAVVQEYVQQEQLIYPAGTTHYTFLVDLGGKTALGTTADQAEADYEASKDALDRIRANFEVVAGVP